ncbi:unnamed protein product [Peniophora sp. CBMAI 1063]|nr:unnamed protein product [Peniophora sp. CBMAI 1063]
MELMRCKGCEMDSYCSRECQQKEEVRRVTGDTREWGRFTRWLEYHHTSLINTALAAYNAIGPHAHESCVLFIHLVHVKCEVHENCNHLPYERSLQAQAIYLVHRDSQAGRMYENVFRRRDEAQLLSRQEHGASYAGTGAYLLLRTYAEGTPDEAVILYSKYFGYDKYHAQARPIGDPMKLLGANINEGKRPRFCCGKFVEAMSGEVCCCGGWTHANTTEGQSSEVD